MIVLSKDGSLEVTTSNEADASGKFTVSAKQLTTADIRAFINVIFNHDPENSTRIDYETQKDAKIWRVNGSHTGDVISEVQITITSMESKR
jgi:hypothetical protein